VQEDIGSKTKAGLMWNTGSKIVFQAFRFGVSIAIARILDPKDFGIMGIATMLVFYANSITNFGFNQALIQRKDIEGKHIYTVFTINVAISSSLAVITVLLSNQIALFFQIPELTNVLLVLSSIFILTSFYQMPMTLMKRQIDFKTVALTELLRGLIQTFTTLALALQGFQYWALVIGLVTSYIFGTIFILVKTKWKPRIRYSHSAMKDVINFGLWNFLRTQTYHINEYAANFIIGKFLGPISLGYYEKAFSTIAIQKESFSKQFNAVMFSSFSRIQSEKNERVKKYFLKAVAISSLITLPISAGFFALGSYFVLILLGDKWEPMIMTLKILAITFIFNNLCGMVTTLNIGLGDYVKHTLRVGFCSILMIILSLLLVQGGIEYVSMGILFVYALMFVMTYQITKNNLQAGWMDILNCMLPAVAGSIVMVLTILALQVWIFNEINLGNFVFLTSAGVLSYILAVFCPRYMILEEYRASILNRIKEMAGNINRKTGKL